MTRSPSSSFVLQRRARSARSRGFTLIELLVAVGAGLSVALAALLLARNATHFFQNEARIAGAQLSATLGMNRLITDISRAGFLATPNIQHDGKVCGTKVNYQTGLSMFSAVELIKGGSVAANPTALAQSTANGMNPDAIVIGGCFDTTEQFPIRFAGAGAGGTNIVSLQTASGAFQRAWAAGHAGGIDLAAMFRQGRYLRLVGPANQEIYALIDGNSLTATGGPPPASVTITLANNPPIPVATGGQCGLTGLGSDWLVNPVSRIRYDIRSMKGDTNYGPLVASNSGTSDVMTGDDLRTELVRVELDQNNGEALAGATPEVVAEFAVDLKFGARVSTIGTNPVLGQRVALYDASDAAYDAAANVSTVASATPEHLRSIEVRLATRARAPDREVDMVTPTTADGARARMQIGGVAAKPLYARVRTMHADVTLMNLAGVTW